MSVPIDDPLGQEHAAAQRAALAERRRFTKSPEGVLAASLRVAVQLRDDMRAAGATPAELETALEQTVRAAWPRGRAEPWHFLCDDCSDTGLIMLTCRAGRRCGGVSSRTDGPRERSGRHQRLCVAHDAYEHDYGIACQCRAGQRFKPVEHTPASAIEAAAKTSKPTRFGR